MHEELSVLRKELERLQHLDILVNTIQESAYTLSSGECATAGYTLKNVAEQLDILRKKVMHVSETLQTYAVIAMARENIGIIRTEEFSATCHNKVYYKCPSTRKSNPQWFDQVLIGLGIPKAVAEKELVRLHGPAFAEYCAVADPLPLGIKTDTLAGVEFRLKYK
jgi:hypothetical protein